MQSLTLRIITIASAGLLMFEVIKGGHMVHLDGSNAGDSIIINEARWILELHKGNIGSLKLEAIYPFLNALGLLALLATGTSMLLQRRSLRRRTEED